MAKAEKEMSSGESPAPEKSLLERNLHLFGGSGDDDDEGGGDSRPKSEWDPMNLQESKDYAAKQLTEFRLLQAKEVSMGVDLAEQQKQEGGFYRLSPNFISYAGNFYRTEVRRAETALLTLSTGVHNGIKYISTAICAKLPTRI